MKVAVIGGGSTYTPELMEGLILRREELSLDEVVLQDIDLDRLDPVAGFCRRMASHLGAPDLRVRDTRDLPEALSGASFVVVQVRVGGQKARHLDETLPLRHGCIGQETTGAGGFAKAMRTIPVLLEIAEAVKRHAPGAWWINFTNPSGMVTEALMRHGGVRTVGLCNIPMEMRIQAAELLGAPVEEVLLDYVGLNHLGFVRGVRWHGKDRLPDLLASLAEFQGPANLPGIEIPGDVVAALGAIPSGYVRYYYCTEEVLQELQRQPRSRAEVVMDLEERLLAIYRDPAEFRKPDLLQQRGGAWYSRVAVDVMAALLSPVPSIHVVNARNGDTVPGLPADATVEVPCRVSAHGVEPLPLTRRVPDEMMGLIAQVKAYERLAIEAAVTRSRRWALLALMAHPLVRTAEKARGILEEMTRAGSIPPLS
ncbi:MAG TPA: 6-phospho-beta-glucosidase [Myxococcota bacterium]|nr:6-phospho-beta-glucosidase [Myxococcota bacterium]HQK50508.1 6-phospho-beta-glucosidase [Myxococcota bacterium]